MRENMMKVLGYLVVACFLMSMVPWSVVAELPQELIEEKNSNADEMYPLQIDW